MKIYRVGGAVRDRLLGLPVTDRDWVVVGASPAQMLAAGFRQVGADFPVFLHPDSHEEYALARTERKQGHGYHGFSVYAGPDVTLEQDLQRRDLTINAMAEDDAGALTDPWGGQRDLQAKVLRHVSPAFAEDPLRVLRVARFAARFEPLGFSVAAETLAFMATIVRSGELAHLTPERVWQETRRALMEARPDIYFRILRQCGALKVILPELDVLFGVPQPPAHHPEIDTGEHVMLVLRQAALRNASLTVRFATLVHDLGKGTTPPTEWPRHIAHEARGDKLVQAVCDRLRVPNDCRDLARLCCRYHTHAHRALELRPETVLELLGNLDAIRRPERYEEWILACECDARGRTGLEDRNYPQADYLRAALAAVQTVNPQTLIDEGFSGKALGDAIQRERRSRLKALKRQWQPSDPPEQTNQATQDSTDDHDGEH